MKYQSRHSRLREEFTTKLRRENRELREEVKLLKAELEKFKAFLHS